MYRFLLLFCITISCELIQAQTQNKNIVFKGKIDYQTLFTSNRDLSNIGGYVDSTGKEYALVGWEQGLSIVDVSNPTTPVIVKQVTGNTSVWREVKVRSTYAYVTTEGGGGLQIINLRSLPNAAGIVVKQYTPNIAGQALNTIHALHVDGVFLYLYGSNIGNRGAYVFNITDGWNPIHVGQFDERYIHDGQVKNDTLYACHIYEGFFSIVDFRDKNNPIELGTQSTPKNFSHNSWLSDNSKYAFLTDEVDDSFLASYDVSDPNNITELDRIQSQNPGSQSIVHNTHVTNTNWTVTSWYKDGVIITDITRPNNLVNVGWYDTSPLQGGDFDGCWGVYSYLPSGNLVCSDISEGLFVLAPTYKRACYLEGIVKDSLCGDFLQGVEITATKGSYSFSVMSDLNGNYRTGTPDSGLYNITIAKIGYQTITISNALLSPGQVYNVQMNLSSGAALPLNGNVNNGTVGIPNCQVLVENQTESINLLTSSAGDFYKCNVSPDTYNVIAGKWGYVTKCENHLVSVGAPNYSATLQKNYYDDFSLDFGWTVNTTASAGDWQRGVPLEEIDQGSTIVSPGNDVSIDCGNKAFITGNYGGSPGTDDVDDGYTWLSSPIFDLSGVIDPHIKYSRFFYNGGGASTPNDTLIVLITNGIQSVPLEKVIKTSAGASTWVNKDYRLNSLITPTSTMQVIVKIEDYLPGHRTEGGFDAFEIYPAPTGLKKNEFNNFLYAYPNPFTNEVELEFSNFKFTEDLKIEIKDVSGRTVEILNAKSDKIIAGQKLPVGIYFVSLLKNENLQQTIKLVKLN